MKISLDTSTLPDELRRSTDDAFQAWYEESDTELRNWYLRHIANDDGFQQRWARAWAASPQLAQWCCQQPTLPQIFFDNGLLQTESQAEDYQTRLRQYSSTEDETTFNRQLRQFKRTEQARLIWRDLGGYSNTHSTLRETTALAQLCLDTTLAWHYRDLSKKFGNPLSESGQQQQLVVLGMGKLGGGELNLSSDLDLILCWPESGSTGGSASGKHCSNHEFFERLGRKLISSLDAVTAEGYVYRIDMRLRPYGKAGPLVMNFNALESYYESQGRDWERYALCKVRPVAGDIAAGEQLLKRLKAFVYRRYLDFSALEALRSMAGGIRDSLSPEALEADIKRGTGGIREIEFIAQFFQLAYGGVKAQLRQVNLLKTLDLLASEDYLEQAEQLASAYCFLRDTEHALQGWGDQQTHSLPRDTKQMSALSLALDCAGVEDFNRQLTQHQATVHQLFEKFASPPPDGTTESYRQWRDLWLGLMKQQDALNLLTAGGYQQPAEKLAALEELRNSYTTRLLIPESRRRLDQFMPKFLQEVAQRKNPDLTFDRLLPLVETIKRRSIYLSLLNETPSALEHLVSLCEQSNWIASELCKRPANLDELLDLPALYAPLNRQTLKAELSALLPETENTEDEEAFLNGLRRFKASRTMSTAAQELHGDIDCHSVGIRLALIAEVLLERICGYYLTDLLPEKASVEELPPFTIIAYGRLGGREMNYHSDLDLVFLYDADPQATIADTDNTDCASFFNRLAKRIIKAITTPMVSGILYATDMRLRPAGSSGLLVSNWQAYERYQHTKAWTWEHQALIRARAVAGNRLLTKKFEDLRRQIIARPRQIQTLRSEVLEMRRKLQQANPDEDLKHGSGSLLDLEFIVQYTVLAEATKCPELLDTTRMNELLEIITRQRLLPTDKLELLKRAWTILNTRNHSSILRGESKLTADEKLLSQQILACSRELLGAD